MGDMDRGRVAVAKKSCSSVEAGLLWCDGVGKSGVEWAGGVVGWVGLCGGVG